MEIVQARYIIMPEVKISAASFYEPVVLRTAELGFDNQTDEYADQSLELTSSVEVDLSPVKNDVTNPPSFASCLGGMSLLAVGALVVLFAIKKK